jgi:hypothetical protein
VHSTPAPYSPGEGRLPAEDVPVAVSAAAYWRVGVLLCALVAVAMAYAACDPTPLLRADPGLARLLRGMAVLKALIALPVLALVYWRFGSPVSPRIAIGYLAGVSMMTAGPALIWQLSFIGPVALLFHAALIGLLLIARHDGPRWQQLARSVRRRSFRAGRAGRAFSARVGS